MSEAASAHGQSSARPSGSGMETSRDDPGLVDRFQREIARMRSAAIDPEEAESLTELMDRVRQPGAILHVGGRPSWAARAPAEAARRDRARRELQAKLRETVACGESSEELGCRQVDDDRIAELRHRRGR